MPLLQVHSVHSQCIYNSCSCLSCVDATLLSALLPPRWLRLHKQPGFGRCFSSGSPKLF